MIESAIWIITLAVAFFILFQLKDLLETWSNNRVRRAELEVEKAREERRKAEIERSSKI